jgi:hypothetical protein
MGEKLIEFAICWSQGWIVNKFCTLHDLIIFLMMFMPYAKTSCQLAFVKVGSIVCRFQYHNLQLISWHGIMCARLRTLTVFKCVNLLINNMIHTSDCCNSSKKPWMMMNYVWNSLTPSSIWRTLKGWTTNLHLLVYRMLFKSPIWLGM